MRKIAAILAVVVLAGCRTEVEIPVVEPWEGRYPTVEEFRAATDGIELKGGQQIWVLSNNTIYRLLKKTEK